MRGRGNSDIEMRATKKSRGKRRLWERMRMVGITPTHMPKRGKQNMS